MAISTQAIKYGWVALASLGVITGTTIYVASNARKQVKPEDIIELALGTDERITVLQTADGTYPVPRLSFVRTWTSNVYVTNGVTVYTNIVTNTIGWHTDRAMMVELDTKIKAIVPYYKDDTKSNYPALTFTGLLVSLSLGDGTNFTRTPAIGTNTATYGDYPWQIYEEDLAERYKMLNVLEYTSNSYMMVTGDVVMVWWQAPAVSGLTPSWVGTWTTEGGVFIGFTWEEIKQRLLDRWMEWSSSMYPRSPYSFYSYQDNGGNNWNAGASASEASYVIGIFPTNQSHSVRVQARSVRSGTYWSDVGKVGPEDEWVDIINVTNSFATQHVSSVMGSLDMALAPTNEPWTGLAYSRGNSLELKYEAWYGPDQSQFVTNGTLITNSVFGSNYVFYYATNKYW